MITKLSAKIQGIQRIVLGLVFVSGGLSLAYQVFWQRQLSSLLGSDSQSSSLIVSLFLLGLSAGYFVFSRFNIAAKERSSILQIYAGIEMLIALWAHYSPATLDFLYTSVAPESFAGDILFTMTFILPPTFMMGASLPLLTSCLPKSQEEIHKIHFMIYGVNTLGAAAGVLTSFTLLLIPFGLSELLNWFGVVNFFLGVSLLFIPLKGKVVQNLTQNKGTQTSLPSPALYALAFFSGVLIISLEIFSFRLMALTLGGSLVIFPMVLFFFVFYPGLSSAKIDEVSDDKLLSSLWWGVIGFIVFFLIIPVFPLWTISLKVVLISEKITFWIFHSLAFILMGGLFFLMLYPLGRVLPISFGLLTPSGTNSTKRVGIIYGLNTIGTLFGGVIVGHWLLNFLDIPDLLRILGVILVFFGLWIADRLNDNFSKSVFCAGLVLFSILPFNRGFHDAGLFRGRKYVKSVHFHNMFKAPKSEAVYLKDGPHATVAAKEYGYDSEVFQHSRSIFVNGKSDSSTTGDFGTVTLLGLYPYLYAVNPKVNVAVIGMGTGVTLGTLAQFDDVEEVHVAEISKKVIQALPTFSSNTYEVHKSEKLKIHNTDAFRFFSRTKKKFDFIVSEPSNPWTTGVELLYTQEFYLKAAHSLTEEGEFVQWMHTYSMDKESLNTILYNITKVFPYAEVLRTQSGDILVRASERPLLRNLNEDRKVEGSVIDILRSVGIYKAEFLPLLSEMQPGEIPYTVHHNKVYTHNLDTLLLGARCYLSFYMGKSAKVYSLRDPYLARTFHGENPFIPNLFELAVVDPVLSMSTCMTDKSRKFHGRHNLFCKLIYPYVDEYLKYKNNSTNPEDALTAYNILRDKGFILEDKRFLAAQYKTLMKGKKSPNFYGAYKRLQEAWMKDGKYKTARDGLIEADGSGRLTYFEHENLHDILISKNTHRRAEMRKFLKRGRKTASKYFEETSR